MMRGLLLAALIAVATTQAVLQVCPTGRAPSPSTAYTVPLSDVTVEVAAVRGSACKEIDTADGDVAFLVMCPTVPSTPILLQNPRVNVSITELTARCAIVVTQDAAATIEFLDDRLTVCSRTLLTSVAAREAPTRPLIDANMRFNNKAEIISTLSTETFYLLEEQLSGAKHFELNGESKKTLTRQSFTSDNALSAEWLTAYFTALGYSNVYQQSFSVSGKVTQNVVAVHPGVGSNSDEIVVIGAHFDSTSNKATTLAPGAVDNGSGTAGVMMLAAAFAPYQFNRTLYFVAFSGEEQGLYGSKHFVSVAQQEDLNIAAALIMDMIAYSNEYFGVLIEGTKNAAIQELMGVLNDNTETWASQLEIEESTNSFGSDHVPFQQAGIPAILAIELDQTDYPEYHSTKDTVAYVNSAQAVDILKGVAGAAYDLAVAGDMRDM